MPGRNRVYDRTDGPILNLRRQREEMLTDTELEFKQVWCGQVFRARTFPPLTPIKVIAEDLLCTEAPLRKALTKRQTQFKQWDITRK